MFKWLFYILIFATNIGSGKYQNKEKPLVVVVVVVRAPAWLGSTA